MTDIPASASVLIVGGGPCGLTLAIELGRRGISTVLVDAKEGTAFNPQANATQARTMEHFRRLGFADEIRALGLPPHHPTDIAYYVCFGPAGTSQVELVQVAGARWAIEECFQTAKNEAGLDQYQVRSWRAWHAHITLAMLAAAYLAATRAREAEKGDLAAVVTG